jgi:hypothetical protein
MGHDEKDIDLPPEIVASLQEVSNSIANYFKIEQELKEKLVEAEPLIKGYEQEIVQLIEKYSEYFLEHNAKKRNVKKVKEFNQKFNKIIGKKIL